MPFDLSRAASAWSQARRAGVAPKVFTDLLYIEPTASAHIDARRAAGDDDETILEGLGGPPSRPPGVSDVARAWSGLDRIAKLPADQRDFALFETRGDYRPLGLSPEDVDGIDASHPAFPQAVAQRGGGGAGGPASGPQSAPAGAPSAEERSTTADGTADELELGARAGRKPH